MLIALSRTEPDSAEEAALDAFQLAGEPGCDGPMLWLGQHLKMRAVLRDGTQLHVGLSLTECVSLHRLLDDDPAVRLWSEVRVRPSQVDGEVVVPALASRAEG